MIEARFADGGWCRGRLVRRIPGANPPRRSVRSKGEEYDDICLDGSSMLVRFDAAAYCTIMEVERNGTWHRGKLVELIKGSIVCGCGIRGRPCAIHRSIRTGAGQPEEAKKDMANLKEKNTSPERKSINVAKSAAMPSRTPTTWQGTHRVHTGVVSLQRGVHGGAAAARRWSAGEGV